MYQSCKGSDDRILRNRLGFGGIPILDVEQREDVEKSNKILTEFIVQTVGVAHGSYDGAYD